MRTFVLANRQNILDDVKQSFKNSQIALFEYKQDMKPFLATAKNFADKVIKNSSMGEKIRIILAGPSAIAYILGMTFAHSSRNIVFSYLDLETRKYVDLELSDHKEVHV